MLKLLACVRCAGFVALLMPLLAACQPPPASPTAATQAPAKPTQPAAPAKPATEPAKPAAGLAAGTFVVAELGPLPRTLHPYPDSAAYTESWSQVARLILAGGLMDQDANTLEYVPYMASEWSVSPDGKTFTFKLRDGLKWSDGQPITVDDFVFAWDNASKEENDFVGLDDLMRIESFTAPDARTIVVKLEETLAKDVAISVASSIAPVPKHVWQGKPWNDPVANPEILKPTVVGGPYVLKDWNAAEAATFERNPNWFRGRANF